MDPSAAPMDRHSHPSAERALLDYAIEELQTNQGSQSIQCKICSGDAPLFDVVDFHKACHRPPYMLGLSSIPVTYRRCQNCRFIFTTFFDRFSKEYWKAFVYNDEYIEIDPDYLDLRPRLTVQQIESFLIGRKSRVIGLDYGGGNGKTTSLLRERGWAFDCYDPFDHVDMTPERSGRYNFCSAMEVFEHTPDPVGSLRAIVDLATDGPLTIMIGTLTHDRAVSDDTRLSWWYASPRNGHVSLYSRRSLEIMAESLGLTYVAVTGGTHMMLRHGNPREVRARLWTGRILQRLARARSNG